jgi:AcrR family transcriptional regulator
MAGTPRKLGRPPNSPGDTRERILRAARESFAELGYGTTTNNHIATKAGVTGGALYHYFESKLELYLAAYGDAQDLIGERFDEAIASADTFVGQFNAVLEASDLLNREDPTLAKFVGSAQIDMERHDDLRAAVEGRYGRMERVTPRLVETAVATGEIDKQMAAPTRALVRTILSGLVYAVSNDRKQHRAATDAIEALIEGRLVRPKKVRAARPKKRAP